MNTKVQSLYIKTSNLGGTNELYWFIRKFPGSSKRAVVCNVSILYSLFLMT